MAGTAEREAAASQSVASYYSVLVCLAAAVTLQGCDIPRHTLGNWQAKPSYLQTYQFTALGAPRINSCSQSGVPADVQCNGHGKCAEWFDAIQAGVNITEPRVMFCECDADWSDPECSTPRKSQLTAFLLSMFLGVFGADHLYLGSFWPWGVLKLVTLGGGGIWWIFDIVRIGSVPVPTEGGFRVSNNLAHWTFVLATVSFMGLLGFALSFWSIDRQRIQKAREVLLLQAEGPQPAVPQREMSAWSHANVPGYGTTWVPKTVG